MKTISFKIILGIAAGYGHNLAGVASTELANKVAEDWQKIAELRFEENGIYIAAVVKPAAVAYSPNWGCPVGGETVVEISGTCNPEFTKPEDYKKEVVEMAKIFKSEYEQSTLTIEFFESDIVYLKD